MTFVVSSLAPLYHYCYGEIDHSPVFFFFLSYLLVFILTCFLLVNSLSVIREVFVFAPPL